MTLTADAHARLSHIKVLALDVDGTLTDGTVLYSDTGEELKPFHIQDGLGIVLAGFAYPRLSSGGRGSWAFRCCGRG
jgi:hypothetical protein